MKALKGQRVANGKKRSSKRNNLKAPKNNTSVQNHKKHKNANCRSALSTSVREKQVEKKKTVKIW